MRHDLKFLTYDWDIIGPYCDMHKAALWCSVWRGLPALTSMW